MSELRNAFAIFRGVPMVTLQVPADSRATWAGKWHLNIATEYVEALGGPWHTQDAARSAVLASGRWREIQGLPFHFERI